MKSVACALLAVGASAAQDCPGSPAHLSHASCKVLVNVGDSCAFIMSEIKCRVAGQPGNAPCTGYDGSPALWQDPHNNGTYTILSQTATELKLQRVTGDKKYTDKLNLVFTEVPPAGGCNIEGCSESQVTSYSDSSTNYCNLRNLYCNDAGCKTAMRGSMSTEMSVSTGAGATHDPSKCFVTTEAPPPLVLSTTNAEDGPMHCSTTLSVGLYRKGRDGSEWCYQYCVTPVLVPAVKVFLEFGFCKNNGYPTYDHTKYEEYGEHKQFQVDVYKASTKAKQQATAANDTIVV